MSITLLFICGACKTPKSTFSAQNNEKKDFTVFINCTMQEDTVKNTFSITNIKQIIKQVVLKETSTPLEELDTPVLTCQFKDYNFKTIKTIYFSDPMKMNLEYLDSNQQFVRKTFYYKSKDLAFRLLAPADSKQLCFIYKNKEISLIKLHQKQ